MGMLIWLWLLFLGLVGVLLVFDFGVLNCKEYEIGVVESLKFLVFYIMLGVFFGGFVWYQMGSQVVVEYMIVFVVEKMLVMDNVFVIVLIFVMLLILCCYQYCVLFWGILGVILLCGLMIGLGVMLVVEYGWILYIFVGFLILIGIKMLFVGDKEYDMVDNLILKFLCCCMLLIDELYGYFFIVKQFDFKIGCICRFVMLLLLVLVMIEIVDVIFVVDLVFVVFVIMMNFYIVYILNIFVILGLCVLFFVLVVIIYCFEYLKQVLVVLLIFIGLKVFFVDLMGMEKFLFVILFGIIFVILGVGVVYLLWCIKGQDVKELIGK